MKERIIRGAGTGQSSISLIEADQPDAEEAAARAREYLRVSSGDID